MTKFITTQKVISRKGDRSARHHIRCGIFRHHREQIGSSIAESAIAAIVLVPIALAILDLIVVISANSINDTAAKNAARAASNQQTKAAATNAVVNAMSTFHKSSIITGIDQTMDYGTDQVTILSIIKVHLPIPVPGCSDLTFQAKDVEPILTKQ